ncbi:MAG: HEAT repeat domain-containing protein, partial [Planctomycetota bacterium]
MQPPDHALDDQQHETRHQLTSLLISNLKHSDAKVRLAALRALGKVAGGAATQHLLSMLDDAVQEVREDAILALGTTGSARSVHALMHIASYGRAPGSRRQTIGRSSRPLAVIALGLARRYGARTELDSFVRNLTLDNKRTSKTKVAAYLQRDLVMAKLLYATLVGSGVMQETAHQLAGGKKTTLELRSRALESLATMRDPDSLQVLERSLTGHKLEARRSAALALGGFDSPKAFEPLRRACKSEHEQLTCAFLQISLGQRGGVHARKILLHNLGRGRRSLRPWAAIGLGLLARAAPQRGGDEKVLNALRKAYRSERNRGSRGAYLLALGLARDAASVHELAHAVREAKVPA